MTRRLKTFLPWLLPLSFLGLFYFYPLGSIFGLSFQRQEGPLLPGLLEELSRPAALRAIHFTFYQAGLSTLLTLALGLPAAYLFGRYTFPGKKLLRALTGVPFVMPTLVVAAGFSALLGTGGWINQFLMDLFQLSSPPIQFQNTLAAILTAHVFYNTTIVIRVVGDFWSRLDPRVGQAGAVLGASPWRVFRRITLPLLAPAVLAAALLVFIFDFTSFGVVLILGGPRFATLEVEIYQQTISLFNLPLAGALSLLQLACTLSLTVIYTRLTSRLARPLSLQSRKRGEQRLRTGAGRAGAAVLILVLLLLMVTPLLALASRSFLPLSGGGPRAELGPAGPTLAFYKALGQNPQQSLFYVAPTTALGVSLGYALLTVVLALGLGLPAAWALARQRDSLINKILDPLLMLPLGTSAVTLGLGFLIALDTPPLNLRTSPLLIPLAHTLVAFPFVVRSLTPALESIRPEIRQAAAVLGASPRQVRFQIDLPLIGQALLVAASFAFTISLGEFGATALIVRPEYPTVPVVIYRFLSRPGVLNYGQAMALSTILMLAALGGMLVMERFRVGEVGEF